MMSLFTKIIIGIIVLHLILGFGWLFYKLRPKDGEGLIDNSFDESEETQSET